MTPEVKQTVCLRGGGVRGWGVFQLPRSTQPASGQRWDTVEQISPRFRTGDVEFCPPTLTAPLSLCLHITSLRAGLPLLPDSLPARLLKVPRGFWLFQFLFLPHP